MEDVIDPLSFVAPEFRDAAAEMAAYEANSPPAVRASIAAMRNSPFFAAAERLADVAVFECHAPVASGHPEVLLFVINAQSNAKRPAILHTHGGGHIAGTARSEVPRLQALAGRETCPALYPVTLAAILVSVSAPEMAIALC